MSATPTTQHPRRQMAAMLAGRTDEQIRNDYRAAWVTRKSVGDDLAAADFSTDARRALAADVDALNLTMSMIAADMNRRGWGDEGRAFRAAVVDGRA